jgi:hypothetical protein
MLWGTARQPGRVVVVEAADGAPELAARDGVEGMCVTLGDDARPAEACGDPTRRDDRAAVTTYDGTALGGVVPATAARVELVFPDGTIRRPALQPGSRYRGRLVGRVAFFVVAVPQRSFADGPGGSEDVEIRVFDAAGTLVGVHADPSATGRAIGPERTAVRRRLGRARFSVDVRPVSQRGGLRLHRIAVPPRAALRSITIRRAGRRPDVHRLALPPAREQCGYDSSRVAQLSALQT